MANPIIQYFKDTRGELNHVAWPTQNQTIVFTVLVAALSLGVAAYLGAFDYLFTTLLSDVVTQNQSSVQVTQPTATTTSTGPTFNITGATTTK